jgi:hypothetical protein
MIIIQTPAELNGKVGGIGLKRKMETEAVRPLPAKKLAVAANSCHLQGTIYEARLGPLAPATTLPVAATARMAGPPRPAVVDSALQAQLLHLVEEQAGDDLVKFLEKHSHRVDVNQYGEDGVTPLQRVCQEGGPVGVARLLVRYGADVRMTSRDGWSPLHMASYAGNTALILYLLSCRH